MDVAIRWTVRRLLSKCIRWMALTCSSVIDVLWRYDLVLSSSSLKFHNPQLYNESFASVCTMFSCVSLGVIPSFCRYLMTALDSIFCIFTLKHLNVDEIEINLYVYQPDLCCLNPKIFWIVWIISCFIFKFFLILCKWILH